MKHIIGIILKAVFGIIAVICMAGVAFGAIADKMGWAKRTKCKCGGDRITWHGPLEFMNE